VIKSYTEDDVQKSLKYEIWSSTDPGNKRLDKAFKENAGRGSIYLFFSVNARYKQFYVVHVLKPALMPFYQWPFLRYGRNANSRRLYAKQYRLGL
jgi:hypothetical protein